MPLPLSLPQSILPRPVILAAMVVSLLLAIGIALWAHYGTAVFYEMVLAGIALCM